MPFILFCIERLCFMHTFTTIHSCFYSLLFKNNHPNLYGLHVPNTGIGNRNFLHFSKKQLLKISIVTLPKRNLFFEAKYAFSSSFRNLEVFFQKFHQRNKNFTFRRNTKRDMNLKGLLAHVRNLR